MCPSVLEVVSVSCPSSRRRSSCCSTFYDYLVFGIVMNVFIVYLLVLEKSMYSYTRLCSRGGEWKSFF